MKTDNIKSLQDVLNHMVNEFYEDSSTAPFISTPYVPNPHEVTIFNMDLNPGASRIGTKYRATGNEINIYAIDSIYCVETPIGSVPSTFKNLSALADLALGKTKAKLSAELAEFAWPSILENDLGSVEDEFIQNDRESEVGEDFD